VLAVLAELVALAAFGPVVHGCATARKLISGDPETMLAISSELIRKVGRRFLWLVFNDLRVSRGGPGLDFSRGG
jgi:hypothetical protein